ncbi:MAG: DUF4388 domain-containing protein [Pseudomonadota bacterium]
MTDQTSPTYALRFISGKYQGGEFPLKPDKEIIIGRSSELDMVLVEDMVSRKHAKISTADGQISIQDLGSTNGTFVNGEKIKRVRLREGDRILIGTSIIKLVATEGAPSQKSSLEQPNEPTPAPHKHTAAIGAKAMAGTIDEVPLPDLLQLLTTSKKSGLLELQGKNHLGRIYLRNGQIYYASIDEDPDLSPLKATLRLLTWQSGTFELNPPDDKEFVDELDEPTEALLMEAMRQLDEIAEMKNDLPPRDAQISLVKPMVSPLRGFTPQQLDVIQLVYNHGQVGKVLDKHPDTDLDVYRIIIDLLKSNVLVTEG